MRLVIGTTNPGKVAQMAGALADTGFECVPIAAFGGELPTVEEVGPSPEAIAEIKAVAYAEFVDCPVLSLDQWLVLDEVADADQPLARVRRMPGRPDGGTDDELVAYYSALCERYGGRLTARWRLGIAVASDGVVASTCLETVRTLVPTPSPVRKPGLPLSCLQIDTDTGKYVSEHNAHEEVALWQRVYGDALVRFVTDQLLTSTS